jgi:hypothetical protein
MHLHTSSCRNTESKKKGDTSKYNLLHLVKEQHPVAPCNEINATLVYEPLLNLRGSRECTSQWGIPI